MHLYAFTSALSLSLFVGEELAPPVAPNLVISTAILKAHPSFTPHHPFAPHQPFQKPHYPLLCTITLASLVKGRWIDGKAQTVVLLHFACDTSTFLIYQTFRRQDGGIATPLLLKPHYPSPRTTALASLVKGEVLSPERIRATTGGIATPLSPRLRKPFQNRTIPLAFRRGVSSLLPLHIILPFSQPLQKDNNPSPRTTTLASLVKGEVLSPERIRATTGGIAFLPHPFRFSDTSVNNPSIVGSASHCNRSSLYTRELKVIVLYQPF